MKARTPPRFKGWRRLRDNERPRHPDRVTRDPRDFTPPQMSYFRDTLYLGTTLNVGQLNRQRAGLGFKPLTFYRRIRRK